MACWPFFPPSSSSSLSSVFDFSFIFPPPLAFGWQRWRRQRLEEEAEMKGENRKWMASLFGYLSLLRLMIEMIVIVFKVKGNGCERSQVQRCWAFIHAVLVLSSSLFADLFILIYKIVSLSVHSWILHETQPNPVEWRRRLRDEWEHAAKKGKLTMKAWNWIVNFHCLLQ